MANPDVASSSMPANLRVSSDRQHSAYRPDIDGLRAVAVLAVVVFHAFPTLLPGGFIGVDVFFVISGFLITGIITSALRRGTFRFEEFYARRVRRIFPALVVVLLAIFAISWFLFVRIEDVGRQTVAGAAFLSNLALAKQGNYFDPNADATPFLHLWSLAVEEQFYLLWPLLLFIGYRRRVSLPLITSVIAVLSFGANLYLTRGNPTVAFYSPWSRFWELMTGGLLAFDTVDGRRNDARGATLQATMGLLMIVLGIFAIRPQSAFPGWWALLPTVGAFLVIRGGPSGVASRILSSKPAVAVGLISYPLYLWHWPVLFVARQFEFDLSPMRFKLLRLVAVVASVGLAAATYWLIEKPIRFGARRRAVQSLLFAMSGVVCLGAVAWLGLLDGVRFPADTRASASQLLGATDMKDLTAMYGAKPCMIYSLDRTARMFSENGCFSIRDTTRPTVMITGDSHSGALSLGLRPFLVSHNVNVVQVSSGWCEPTLNNSAYVNYAWCREINQLVDAQLASIRPDLVVLDSHWSMASQPPYFTGRGSFPDAVRARVSDILSRGAKRVMLIGQMPTWLPSLPSQLFDAYVWQRKSIPSSRTGVSADAFAMDDNMRRMSLSPATSYFSMRDRLCEDRSCRVSVGPDLSQDLIVWDYGHLTPNGARWVVEHGLGAQILASLDSSRLTASPRRD